MWESQQRLPRAVVREGNLFLVFLPFHPTVISTAFRGFVSGRSDYALRLAMPPRSRFFRLLHGNSGLSVGLFQSEVFQFVHADAGPQKTCALRCLTEDLERRCPFPINAPALAVGLFDNLGNGAWPVEVEIRIQMLAVEPVDRFGVRRTDMSETH